MSGQMSDLLEMWVIYDHPTDIPDAFVARKWLIGPGQMGPTESVIKAESLEMLRRLLPLGFVNIGRSTFDDPKIVEVWL